jgi:guanosine-3',5'-bis(diphosphate) 3'-pyrophosphohydrolase
MLSVAALADLFKALSFAAYAHRAQTRKGSGEPYVNHLIEVARLLAEVAHVDDVDVLRAAVLHDVVEDTDVSADEVERTFGARVRMLVEAVSDDNRLPKAERKRLQIEHMRHAPDEARLIKLADHCSNVATLPEGWPVARRAEYLDWSQQVVAACAGASAELEREHHDRLETARAALARTV